MPYQILVLIIFAAIYGCSSSKPYVVVNSPPSTSELPPATAQERTDAEVTPIPPPVDELVMLVVADGLGMPTKSVSKKVGAMQIFTYSPAATYEVTTAKNITTVLQWTMGEVITSVAGGEGRVLEKDAEGREREVAAWNVEKYPPDHLKADLTQRNHVRITPLMAGQSSNVIVTTNRHVYSIKLTSTERSYMPLVGFVSESAPSPPKPAITVRKRGTLGLGYDILALEDQVPQWTPIRVWDDLRHTYLQFPPSFASMRAPALYAVDTEGNRELVNYGQYGHAYKAERLADVWELRLGNAPQSAVQIRRSSAYRYASCPEAIGCPQSFNIMRVQ